MNDIALKPRLVLHYSMGNASYVAGTSHGKHVLARLSIPDINGTLEERYEIIYHGTSADDVDTRLLEIVSPEKTPLRAVK